MHGGARPVRAALVGGIGVVLVLTGCGAVHGSDAEVAKARALDQRLTAVGLPAIDPDTAASLFGDDGGAVCGAAADGERGLSRANVLAGSAYRSHVRTDVKQDAVAYLGAVIEVYCPVELPNFRRYVAGFDVDRDVPDGVATAGSE